MTLVSVEEAMTRFEELIERVEAGETFAITRPGHPPVLLQPVSSVETSS